MGQPSYDQKSGRLTFETRLTLGNDIVDGGKEVPSRDLFVFDGRLTATGLSGTLKHVDQVYGNDTENQRIKLRMDRSSLQTYHSVEEWRAQADETLKVRGPKW